MQRQVRSTRLRRSIGAVSLAVATAVAGGATAPVALAAPSAKDVSGQIFAVRGNEVVLFNQPRPVRSVARIEGWTPQTLIDQALPSMKASYTDVGASASVFPYDPI